MKKRLVSSMTISWGWSRPAGASVSGSAFWSKKMKERFTLPHKYLVKKWVIFVPFLLQNLKNHWNYGLENGRDRSLQYEFCWLFHSLCNECLQTQFEDRNTKCGTKVPWIISKIIPPHWIWTRIFLFLNYCTVYVHRNIGARKIIIYYTLSSNRIIFYKIVFKFQIMKL